MMIKTFATLSLAVMGLLALTPAADAQTKLRPSQAGPGTLAGWITGAGEPAAGDSSQWGFYMQKNTATGNYAFAGASLLPLPSSLTASNLTLLSFDIPGVVGLPFGPSGPGSANGYCGGGSPRFNVYSGAGTCFLGCAHGTKSQDPVTGWWTIAFTQPLGQYTGCTQPTGTISGVDLIFDDGNDIGEGNVVVDNISIRKGTSSPVVIKNP